MIFMSNLIKLRTFPCIYAITLSLILVIVVPVGASEITEPLLEKTISFKANFICSAPDCCTDCSASGMYFPVTFEIVNPDEVKTIKIHYNVLRPNYTVNLVLFEYEACSGENCYARGRWGQLLSDKTGEGDSSRSPMTESGITRQKYKIRAELQHPIGSTREDTDVYIKMDLVREISPTVTSTTIPSTTTATVTNVVQPLTSATTKAAVTNVIQPLTSATIKAVVTNVVQPTTSATTKVTVTTAQTTIPMTKTTTKQPTSLLTDTPAESTPLGIEIMITAIIGSILLILRKR